MSVLSACARFASAVCSASRALRASTFAKTWPTLTCSPTLTSTAVSVPLAGKFVSAELATLTLPDALTLACTVPLLTVAVSLVAGLAEALPKKP